MTKRHPKPPNPIAKALRRIRPKRKPSAKVYSRKAKTPRSRDRGVLLSDVRILDGANDLPDYRCTNRITVVHDRCEKETRT